MRSMGPQQPAMDQRALASTVPEYSLKRVGSMYNMTLVDLQKWWHSETRRCHRGKLRCRLTVVVEREALASRMLAQT